MGKINFPNECITSEKVDIQFVSVEIFVDPGIDWFRNMIQILLY